MTPPQQLVLPIVVWGDAYIDTFLQLALPTFLAPGNLPYCATHIPTRLIVVTDEAGATKLRNAENVHRAAKIGTVEIRPDIDLSLTANVNKYAVMAAAHHGVVRELQGTHSLICILSPDCLLNDTCLQFAYDKMLEGSNAVLVAGPRAGLQGIRRELGYAIHRDQLTLTSRELVSLLCRNFHPISRSLFVSARKFSTMPSCLYWKVSEVSFVARYFHLHPLMVRILPDVIFPESHKGTVDATLIDDANVSVGDSYVCENSDDMVIVEMTDENSMHIPAKYIFCKTIFIYRWSRVWANARHVSNFMRYTFLFRGDEASVSTSVRRARRDCRVLDYFLCRSVMG